MSLATSDNVYCSAEVSTLLGTGCAVMNSDRLPSSSDAPALQACPDNKVQMISNEERRPNVLIVSPKAEPTDGQAACSARETCQPVEISFVLKLSNEVYIPSCLLIPSTCGREAQNKQRHKRKVIEIVFAERVDCRDHSDIANFSGRAPNQTFPHEDEQAKSHQALLKQHSKILVMRKHSKDPR